LQSIVKKIQLLKKIQVYIFVIFWVMVTFAQIIVGSKKQFMYSKKKEILWFFEGCAFLCTNFGRI